MLYKCIISIYTDCTYLVQYLKRKKYRYYIYTHKYMNPINYDNNDYNLNNFLISKSYVMTLILIYSKISDNNSILVKIYFY